MEGGAKKGGRKGGSDGGREGWREGAREGRKRDKGRSGMEWVATHGINTWARSVRSPLIWLPDRLQVHVQQVKFVTA